MHNNLIELVENQFDDEVIEQLSKLFGESTATTKAAVKSSTRSLLGEILEFEVTDKNSPLLQTLRNQTDRLRDNLAVKLSKGQHSRLIQKGSALLTSLLGEEKLSNLVTELSDSNELTHESMQSIVGITAPVMFSSIRRVAKDKELNRTGLQKFFDSQREQIAKTTPADSTNRIKTDNLTEQPTTSLFNKLAWLAILIGLAYAALNFFQSQYSTNTNARSQDMNKSSLVANNSVIKASVSSTQRELVELLTYIGNTFGKVKDRETAKIALSIIQDTIIKLDNLSVAYNGLPDPEKIRIKQVVGKNINALKSIEKNFKSIPGASSVLKKPINDLAQRLDQYTKP
ncbi:MAG: DUF937 domain-containing protein [Methylococcales bacterium]